ncbi:extracellular matrix regulator RemB [Robertmurraya massiliosenegalensis]|uniref:extracellular matrix regulator RemB n=1 Tax=Robertmurraya massiliosenegalensis TaxID=1287657 RepID=UPI0002EB4E52|nr:extracellular matrix/biofilm biosynthesis regulator RemA family protein [Robertmurraya massiliosenegalensis]
MYVHLGEDILVRAVEIIAILDKETVKSSQYMQELIGQKSKDMIPLTKGTFKSIVITEKAVYYSPLASGTLKKRSTKPALQEI